jgi:hypothetical protein
MGEPAVARPRVDNAGRRDVVHGGDHHVAVKVAKQIRRAIAEDFIAGGAE